MRISQMTGDTRRHLFFLGAANAGQLIKSVSDKNHTVLLLDGLEEDIRAFESPHDRLRQILDMTRGFRRVILTCRLDFIPTFKNLPVLDGYEILAPKRGDKQKYRLKRIYISPLSFSDAGLILEHQLAFWKARRIKKNSGSGPDPLRSGKRDAAGV